MNPWRGLLVLTMAALLAAGCAAQPMVDIKPGE